MKYPMAVFLKVDVNQCEVGITWSKGKVKFQNFKIFERYSKFNIFTYLQNL